jgi:hypothetical protein
MAPMIKLAVTRMSALAVTYRRAHLFVTDPFLHGVKDFLDSRLDAKEDPPTTRFRQEIGSLLIDLVGTGVTHIGYACTARRDCGQDSNA